MFGKKKPQKKPEKVDEKLKSATKTVDAAAADTGDTGTKSDVALAEEKILAFWR